jgi:ribose transport system substrate-binding protein
MTVFRRTSVVGLLLVLALVVVGCTTPVVQPAADTGAAAPAQADHSNDEYIYVSSMGNLEFFNAHKYGWEWAGENLGVKATYVGPAEYDMNAMSAAFDQAIARQPKGIAVFGVEPVLQPQIDKAVEAGIPVVTILGDVPGSKRLAFVGSSQYELGFTGGQKLAEALGGEGQVAILSIPGVAMFDDREQGYRAAFNDHPGIEVVQVGDTKADSVTALSAAKDILQRFPDLDAFAATDSTGGMAAATAVEEAGRAGEVKVVSMDRNSDVLQKIQEGIVTGTVAQNDAAMAFWALQYLVNYNYNQAALTSDNAAAAALAAPSNVIMAANYVDASNLEYYLQANELYKP